MGLNKQVSFEIAKLLKEKGFKPTKLFGYISKVYNPNTKTLLAYGRTGRTDLSKAYFAPTIAEVVCWSFNTYKIWITVDVNINGKFNYFLRQYNSKDRAWEVKNSISISEYFNSPTEAYQAALEYCLTELI